MHARVWCAACGVVATRHPSACIGMHRHDHAWFAGATTLRSPTTGRSSQRRASTSGGRSWRARRQAASAALAAPATRTTTRGRAAARIKPPCSSSSHVTCAASFSSSSSSPTDGDCGSSVSSAGRRSRPFPSTSLHSPCCRHPCPALPPHTTNTTTSQRPTTFKPSICARTLLPRHPPRQHQQALAAASWCCPVGAAPAQSGASA